MEEKDFLINQKCSKCNADVTEILINGLCFNCREEKAFNEYRKFDKNFKGFEYDEKEKIIKFKHRNKYKD